MKATAILLIVAALLLASTVLAANGLDTPRQLIGGGGGSVQSGGFALHSSIGQAVAGGVASGSFNITSGFWPGMPFQHRIYLPLVLRNTS
jgi:hypothetical protein